MLHRGGDIWYPSWWMSRNSSGKKLSKIEVKIQVKETVETVHTKHKVVMQQCEGRWLAVICCWMVCPVSQAEYLCPSKLLCWNLVSNVTAFRVFGRLLDHEGGAFTNGINALIKGTPKSSFAPSSMQGHWEDCHLWTKKQVLVRLWISQHLDLGLLCFWNCEKYFFLSYSVFGIAAQQTKTEIGT